MKSVPFLISVIMASVIVKANPYPTDAMLLSTPPVACMAADTSWETVIDSSSFSSYQAFEKQWNYLYPWGKDHNGTARMYASATDHSQVSLENNILHLRATRVTADEGKSDKDPYLRINYRSGAVHAKTHVTLSNQYPVYEVGGWFKAPTGKGTWPAFWLTAVKGWPPETDILEFKGDSINWQNTFIVPFKATTTKVEVKDADTVWHHYKAILKKVNDADIDIYYYFDNKLTGVHRCNFMNKPMWIIINLQMEGSAEGSGPLTSTDYYIKGISVRRARN